MERRKVSIDKIITAKSNTQQTSKEFKSGENETPTNHNRSRGAGGVWAEYFIHKATEEGNIYAVKQHLAGADVNAKNKRYDLCILLSIKIIVKLLNPHRQRCGCGLPN